MSFILCVETSSKNCSVAIANNGEVYNVKEELDDNYCHGQKLHVLIQLTFFFSYIYYNRKK